MTYDGIYFITTFEPVRFRRSFRSCFVLNNSKIYVALKKKKFLECIRHAVRVARKWFFFFLSTWLKTKGDLTRVPDTYSLEHVIDTTTVNTSLAYETRKWFIYETRTYIVVL